MGTDQPPLDTAGHAAVEVTQQRLDSGAEVYILRAGHDLTHQLLTARDLFVKDSQAVRAAMRVPDEAVSHLLDDNVLNSDGEQHRLMRQLLAPAFSAPRIAELRPRITALAEDLLSTVTVDDDGVADLAGYAFAVPFAVICELLGVPAADRAQFSHVGRDIFADRPEISYSAGMLVENYLTALTSGGLPPQGLIRDLVELREQGTLSQRQVVTNALLLLVAGHDSTSNAIGSACVDLLADRSAWARLRREPPSPAEVDELVRVAAPIPNCSQRVVAPGVRLELGGVRIPPGAVVLINLTAACHDRQKWGADADTARLSRDARGHAAFGAGVHACLGAPLARAVLPIVLHKLGAAFPDAVLAVNRANLRRRHSPFAWGYDAIPVRLH